MVQLQLIVTIALFLQNQQLFKNPGPPGHFWKYFASLFHSVD